MSRHKRVGLFGADLLVLFLAALLPASGQGMQYVLHSGVRVFPDVGPGVAALKKDAVGHYYVIAQPASMILIFDSAGHRIGQLPNANSHGATIRYAVSIDFDSHGLLYVADRGGNAVEVFAPDGALVARVPVAAPTSVVALPDGQFAVTKLQSKRLVQIMDQSGATIRTFGDPADQPGSARALPSVPASSSGTQPMPAIDRGRITGDSSGNIYFAFTSLADPAIQRFDRYGYSAYDSIMPAAQFGALSGHGGRDVEFGYSMSAATEPTVVSAWTDLHSVKTSVSTSMGRRGTSSLATSQAPSGLGTGAASGGAAGSSTTDSSTPAIALDSSDLDTQAVSFDAQNAPGNPELSPFPIAGVSAPGIIMPGMMGMGLGIGGMHGGAGFGGFDGLGPRPEFFGGRSPDGAEGFGHFHPGGFGTYRATATVRVALDDPSKHKLEKPVITALGIDPERLEAWAAIGDMLVHLDSNGNLLDAYYLTITGDTTIKPSAILVEPNRILVASDPWGVYEFPRPDKAAPVPAGPKGALVPHELPPSGSPSH